MPSIIISRSQVSSGDASTPPLMIRSTRVWSSIRANASRSDVITTVVAPTVGAKRATEARTSSASSPAGTTTATPEPAQHVGRELELLHQRGQLVRARGLVLGPAIAPRADLGVVETDDDHVRSDAFDRGHQLGQQPAHGPHRAAVVRCAEPVWAWA